MIKQAEHDNERDRIRVLVIDGQATVRQALVELLEQEPELMVCAEAENVNKALEIMAEQQVDLAIVDISLDVAGGSKLAEEIKSNRPYLSVVLLSIEDETIHGGEALRPEAKRPSSNRRGPDQIIKTVHYAQSLLRSHIFGFTLAAQIERAPRAAC
jgi:DNA-binding NarL/FixJ family response regulator